MLRGGRCRPANDRVPWLMNTAFTYEHQRAELGRCVSHLIYATLTETIQAEHPCEHTFDNQE